MALLAEWNSESLTAFFGGIGMILTGLTATYVALRKRRVDDRKALISTSGTDARNKQKLQHDHIDKVVEQWENLYTQVQERERNCQMELSSLRTDFTELHARHFSLSANHENLKKDHEELKNEFVEMKKEMREMTGGT